MARNYASTRLPASGDLRQCLGALKFLCARSARFFLHAAAETFGADDGAFVQAAHDDFVLVAGFDLEGDLAVFDGNHLRAAMNRLADGRRREVADVKLDADGTLVGLETVGNGFARGAFEKADEMRRGHYGGHAVASKLHCVLHVRG